MVALPVQESRPWRTGIKTAHHTAIEPPTIGGFVKKIALQRITFANRTPGMWEAAGGVLESCARV